MVLVAKVITESRFPALLHKFFRYIRQCKANFKLGKSTLLLSEEVQPLFRATIAGVPSVVREITFSTGRSYLGRNSIAVSERIFLMWGHSMKKVPTTHHRLQNLLQSSWINIAEQCRWDQLIYRKQEKGSLTPWFFFFSWKLLEHIHSNVSSSVSSGWARKWYVSNSSNDLILDRQVGASFFSEGKSCLFDQFPISKCASYASQLLVIL